MDTQRKKLLTVWLSVASNITLVVLKVAVGLLIGSVSIISEAIHSGVDLLAALIALVAVREGGKPADSRHAFGHGKIECVSGAVEAGLIFVAAIWIIYEAVRKLGSPGEIDHISWGLVVMVVSACANWFVSGVLFRVGKETDSMALQADAWHLRTDVWTSGGVAAGLGLIVLGDWLVPDLGDRLHMFDPLAALVVAVLIMRAAWQLTEKAFHDLIDGSLPEEEEKVIRAILSDAGPIIRGYHRVRTRKSGPTRFIQFHIWVDGLMSVQDSHDLAHRLAGQIEGRLDNANVLVHVEPFDERRSARVSFPAEDDAQGYGTKEAKARS